MFFSGMNARVLLWRACLLFYYDACCIKIGRRRALFLLSASRP
ncbi:hypothetical protein APHCRT_0104 [Anaplasma phagocytophilum str. CRT53-1]|uniref:Uncharacterized protein n=1 Tax=Anaplasma phagocytophilum str. CRT53-1 TaxID=1359157 RepID=A0A0F3Q8M3_ANAPH|nr:hypothetical protein APHCRT_0104 [Anaplasma phagocytophilum str. CRT53-1]